eukprot:193157-Rhodomonas_salina.1
MAQYCRLLGDVRYRREYGPTAVRQAPRRCAVLIIVRLAKRAVVLTQYRSDSAMWCGTEIGFGGFRRVTDAHDRTT